ncbi:MAG: hypothetical protein ACREJ2_03230, partial [Planctomycetota bacterium]
ITLEDPAHQSAPKPARASRRADAGTESLPRGRRPLHRKASATSATTPNEVPIKAIGITALIWLMGLFCFVVSNHKSSPSELPPPAAAIPQQVVPMPAPHWRAPDAPDIAPSATTPLHP